ncbi:MAG: hypothetical protein H0W25_10115 [Acidimicrobiia bacterium]|nr:hypothetical protein [Acidimicrobiia bacterium]
MTPNLRRRLLPLGLLVVAATGCEEQEAVSTSKSVPVALLLGASLIGAVVLGLWACRRWADSQPAPPRPGHEGWRALGSAACAVAGGLALFPGAYGCLIVAFHYQEPVTDAFSWEDSVWLTGILSTLGAAVAVFEWRLASALTVGRRWAPWGVGLHGVVVLLLAGSSAVGG